MIDMLTEKISETEDTNQENKRARYNKLKKGKLVLAQAGGLGLQGLKLFRDKNNRYDANSIVIKDKNGSRIGYVPTTKNEILARLLEGGRALYANVIKTKTLSSGVKRIDIKVYMEG